MPALKKSHLAAGLLALCLLGAGPAFADPLVDVARHRPCNLFDLDEPVQFEATFQGLPPGEGKAVVVLTTFYNETTTVTLPLQVKDAQPVRMPLALGKLPPGYYKMKITAEVAGADGKPVIARSQAGSFGVVRFVQRTAAEAREQGMRFGLKIFQIGDPGVWWRRPLVWNLAEVVDACARTGLQWTRHQFNQEPNPAQPGLIGTNELITEHPMNVVLKVEGFPENCFDTGRYGPLEEWKAKHKGRSWTRSTVPAKEPYQAWLKAEVAKIPPGQNIFEIGNEVWNYLPAGEFAEWCRLAVVAIKEARPEAQIGADPGNGDEYTRSFLAAGGMDGMAIWFCHPYSFTPLPEHRVRAYLRNMRDILKGRTGRDFDLYVTEYGWSVAPQSTHAGVVSEVVQAQRTTRESLMLYAEDARALIPHWMGDREQDPKEREHWFGFFQLDQQPRPVFVAHAACARMIDGGKFVGDLPLGEGVGAMLFERGGTYTLALWTAEGAKNVTVEVGMSAVTVANMMGKEKPGATKDGKLELRLDASVTYLVGVSAALAQRVIPPDKDLDPDVWSKRPETFQAGKMAAPPVIDGSLDDWKGRGAIAIPPASTAASSTQSPRASSTRC